MPGISWSLKKERNSWSCLHSANNSPVGVCMHWVTEFDVFVYLNVMKCIRAQFEHLARIGCWEWHEQNYRFLHTCLLSISTLFRLLDETLKYYYRVLIPITSFHQDFIIACYMEYFILAAFIHKSCKCSPLPVGSGLFGSLLAGNADPHAAHSQLPGNRWSGSGVWLCTLSGKSLLISYSINFSV